MKCGVQKPINEFYKGRLHRNGTTAGRCLFCEKGKTRAEMDAYIQECLNEQQVEREEIAASAVGKLKTCYVCNVDRPWLDFKFTFRYGKHLPIGRCIKCVDSPLWPAAAEARRKDYNTWGAQVQAKEYYDDNH